MTELDRVHFEIKWPKERPFQMIGLGLNAVDWICVLPCFPEHDSKVEIERLYRLGGGQVATASALCARYGLKVRYVGRVGNDEIGQFAMQDLRKESMDISCVDIVQGAFSQLAVILVDRLTGERTILWKRDPRMHYKEGELKREWIVQGQILHLDAHDQPASIQAARWARGVGMKVSLDIDRVQPGVEELLELSDFTIATIGFVCQLSGRSNWKIAAAAVSKATPGFLAVTRGREGAAAVWDGEIIEIPGIRVDAVDTTGAGDVFHGAFVYGVFQNWSVGRCLRFANVAGGLACTRYGARGGIPPKEETTRMLEGSSKQIRKQGKE